MKGGIFQLHTKGIQDTMLTGKPEHNFIKQVYRQYDNFSIESKTLFGNEIPTFGGMITFNIKNLGDFLHKLYFCFTLPKLQYTSGTYASWTNAIGHAIIDKCELSIGNIIINSEYGLFMEIWNELTTQRTHADTLIGKYQHVQLLEKNALTDSSYIVPLNFWFCENIGSSLPLMSLKNNSIKIMFKLKNFDECITYDGVTPPNPVMISRASLRCEYIFIDDYLKDRFLNSEHSYIIKQTQKCEEGYIGPGSTTRSILTFNHPCNEIFFVLREIESENNNDWFNFSIRDNIIGSAIEPLLDSAKLVLDNVDFSEYTGQSELGLLNNTRYHSNISDKYIYTIPFCNEPEKIYPNGTLNMSMFSNTNLNIKASIDGNPSRLYVFARNFNWRVIKDGIMRLKYSI